MAERSSLWPVRLVADQRWRYGGLLNTDPHRNLVCAMNDWRRAEYLYGIVRETKPTVAIETGVHVGKSTAVILSAMSRNRWGRLFSIDLPKTKGAPNADGNWDAIHVDRPGDTGSLVPEDLRSRWTLLLGDAKLLLPEIARLGPDLFLHDSDHSYEHMSWEFETVWPHLRAGGILASDDTEWKSREGRMAWADFLERHRGEYETLPRGPTQLRAIRKGR